MRKERRDEVSITLAEASKLSMLKGEWLGEDCAGQHRFCFSLCVAA